MKSDAINRTQLHTNREGREKKPRNRKKTKNTCKEKEFPKKEKANPTKKAVVLCKDRNPAYIYIKR